MELYLCGSLVQDVKREPERLAFQAKTPTEIVLYEWLLLKRICSMPYANTPY